MSSQNLEFVKSQSEELLRKIHEFNVKAFSDEDLNWTYENLKNYIAEGWEIYSAIHGDDIVAALTIKEDDNMLLTKNSSIRVDYQGNGFSHMIKDYFEEVAAKKGISRVINFCPFDNFRMISLNERHGYAKTGKRFGPNNEIVEWEKNI